MNSSRPREAAVHIHTPMAPPAWALLERELIRAQAEAIRAYFDFYFDERGYLRCLPRWGGNDGPDDAGENMLNWTMLHALGGPDYVLDLFRKGWDGHLRQYTEAHTVEVPLAREGMFYKEFITMFDWFHNGEWLSPFVLQGLSLPGDQTYLARSRRYAGFYMDEDPQAPNYDPQRRLIRSMFNGSRGPLLRKATAQDWAGDPIEVEGRFKPRHGENSYEQMLEHFAEYNDVVGDHPLNLHTTTLAFNAYALTGEEKYRRWLIDYIDAWVERTHANSGIVPTNIGLDGTIGGECDGKWYGGVYGWNHSGIDPATGKTVYRVRQFQSRVPYGFGNAVLMTGDPRYAHVWRGVIDRVNENARQIDGQLMYPRLHGDDGWYGYQPEPFAEGAEALYYWTMDPGDRQRAGANPWFEYLEGNRPEYPREALEQDFESLRHKIELMHHDDTSPDTRLSDDMNPINPATTDALARLMLGALPTGRVGFPLHARLRYFDPERRRAGIPEDVGALVQRMTDDGVSVSLVNTNPMKTRTVVVQGGAYAEHHITRARVDGTETQVNASHFTVKLDPGCGARLDLSMNRYANTPTFAFPWH